MSSDFLETAFWHECTGIEEVIEGLNYKNKKSHRVVSKRYCELKNFISGTNIIIYGVDPSMMN